MVSSAGARGGRPRQQEQEQGCAMEGPADSTSSKDTSATAATALEEHEEQEGGHPYGVKPWGNFLTDGDDGDGKEALCVRADGLGPWLRTLPDEALIHSWLPCLEGADLARLSRASRGLYAFAHYPDLWKALVLHELGQRHAALPAAQRSPEGPRLRFRRSWKETYVRLAAAEGEEEYESPARLHRPLRVRGLYSDVLHAPYAAASFKGRLKAAWLSRDNCPRLHCPGLDEFRRACEEPNRPCVLTGVMDAWPALRKWRTPEAFAQAAAAVEAGAEAEEMVLHGGGLSYTVAEYANYAREARHDDLPLYIFDSRFADKSPALAADYSPFLPPYFQQSADLFSLLEPPKEGQEQQQQEQGRPDHRWIIWGPRGSGSTFHKDPNATSAWNAVIKGAKKWVLLPPHVTPPGVHPSADGLDLATPVTLAEWFEAFYTEAAKGPGFREAIVEAVVREGEVMFVPRGWWHLVLNLEESLAITQNFVSEVGLPHVLAFLDEKRHLISGLPDAERPRLYERFVEVLETQAPEALARAQAARRRHGGDGDGHGRGEARVKREGGLLASWQAVVGVEGAEEGEGQGKRQRAEKEEEKVGGFSFGFSF